MDFSAPFDRTSQFVTIAVSGCIALIYIFILNFQKDMPDFAKIMLIVVFLVIVAIPYFFSVRRYTLGSNTLEISFILHKRTIAIADITEIVFPNHNNLAGSIRLFGSGGFFGYSGHYYLKSIGKYIIYANSTRNTVLIRSKQGKTFVLAPETPENFVAILKNYAK
jgi:hypothetical protein